MIFKKKNKVDKNNTNPPLYFQNTLSNEKEEFKPIKDGEVKMYNCGPTVYSEQHIGNMRAAVFADTLRRVLEYNNYKVEQVINITDVGHLISDADEGEDKMEKRAKSEGLKATEIAKKITDIYLKDLENLGINTKAIQFPRATDYIQAQIELTKTLLEKGYAYVIDRGVAFDTSKFKDYGKLGNININDLKDGARVEADHQKHNPTDFWLWKFSDKNENRQQEWKSPWGVGFPGWHIECTAMSRALLGKQLDIHTGGIEHIPIHHNNEIAQSEALSGKKFVNYWMHNAHLMLDGKKISKSVGNVVYLRNITDKGYNSLALRYLFLNAKYNVEQNFTWQSLQASEKAWKKLRAYYIENLMDINSGKIDVKYKTKFLEAINNDLNTPQALAVLWELAKDDSLSKESKKATLQDFDKVFGLQIALNKNNGTKLRVKKDTTPNEVLELLKQRKKAREAKNWTESDKLRDKIQEFGYKIIDSGTDQKLEPMS